MDRNIESLSCEVDGSMVRVYDERGNTVDCLSYPYVENAYSTGRGIVVETETMCYTYVLRGDRLVQSGVRGRSRPSKRGLERMQAGEDAVQCGRQSRSTNYVPSEVDIDIGDSNGKSSKLGCVVVAVLTVFAFLFYGSDNKSNDRETSRSSRNATGQNQTVNSSICWWGTSADRNIGSLHCAGEAYSENVKLPVELQLAESMVNGCLVKVLFMIIDVPMDEKIKVIVDNGAGYEKVGYWSVLPNGKTMCYDGDVNALIRFAFGGDRVRFGFKDRKGNFVMASFSAKEFMRAYDAR